MPLRRQNSRRNPWYLVAILLLLAIAAIGVGGARSSGALAQPISLIKDLLKKKAPAKTKQLTSVPVPGGRGVIPGIKSVIPGAPASPKNAISKATDGNLGVPKTASFPGANPKSVLGKGTDAQVAKSALTKGADPKGTATSALPKGANPKGLTTSALPNGPGPRGLITSALPKGISPRGGFSSPRFAATAPERLRLRADHHLALVAAQRLLPPRPLPGERGFTGVPPVGETRFVSTELVFRVGPNVSRQALDDAARRLGLATISAQDVGITGGTIYHFRLAGGRQVADVVRTLEAQSIGVAQPNYTYRLFQEPELSARSDKAESDQYVIGKLNLEEAHKIATGNNVLVAVIDSAIDVTHPDLAGAIVEQYDAVGRAERPHSHGTGMVGAIAAHQRLMGIAPGAKILAIRAFSSGSAQSPEATTRNILAGMDWAIRKGARVINMSFAGPHDPMLQLAMKNAHAKGVVLIAAAGNLGPKSPPLYPAANPNVIAVTATDENDKLFEQAVRGPHLAVAAPGVDVMVPAPDAGYQLTTGTSVAAAHVSGVAALLIERHPTVSATTILEVLTSSAMRLNPKGRDNLFGWGLVDPAAALAELDSRMEDSKVASAAKPAAPQPVVAQPAALRQAAPKQPAPKSLVPRPASATAQ
jgi:subtilisin family serine protease